MEISFDYTDLEYVENKGKFAQLFLEISVISKRRLFVDGFVLSANQSRVSIARSSAIRDIAGYITESAGLFAGGTSIRYCLGSKGVTTI